MKDRFKYYIINNLYYSLEMISDDFCEVMVFGDNGEFIGSYCYQGANAYAEALEKIISKCETDLDTWERV